MSRTTPLSTIRTGFEAPRFLGRNTAPVASDADDRARFAAFLDSVKPETPKPTDPQETAQSATDESAKPAHDDEEAHETDEAQEADVDSEKADRNEKDDEKVEGRTETGAKSDKPETGEKTDAPPSGEHAPTPEPKAAHADAEARTAQPARVPDQPLTILSLNQQLLSGEHLRSFKFSVTTAAARQAVETRPPQPRQDRADTPANEHADHAEAGADSHRDAASTLAPFSAATPDGRRNNADSNHADTQANSPAQQPEPDQGETNRAAAAARPGSIIDPAAFARGAAAASNAANGPSTSANKTANQDGHVSPLPGLGALTRGALTLRGVGAGTVGAGSAHAAANGAPNAGGPENGAFAAQVARGLAAALRQQGGSLTLRLSPEHLGDLRVQVAVDRGVVSARFEAATSEAQRLLDESMATLRSSLEQRGLGVDSLQVQVVGKAPEAPTEAVPGQAAFANDQSAAWNAASEGHGSPGHRGGGEQPPRWSDDGSGLGEREIAEAPPPVGAAGSERGVGTVHGPSGDGLVLLGIDTVA